MIDSSLQRFRQQVQELGLKQTRQRELIAREFFNKNEHMSADEVHEHVRRLDPKISLATVYRTLKLLVASGLAYSHHFGDGQARFEPNVHPGEHHDHLICTKCGRIDEFFDETIEALQNLIAKHHGFQITRHRMELYGFCPKCRN